MLVFQWNSLKVGDRVMVHDDRDPGLALHDGVVALIQSRPHGVNDVAIRVKGHDPSVLRPRHHAVHLVPFDNRSTCWRCTAISAASVDTSEQGPPT